MLGDVVCEVRGLAIRRYKTRHTHPKADDDPRAPTPYLLGHEAVGELLRPRAHVGLAAQGAARPDHGPQDHKVPGSEEGQGHERDDEVEVPQETPASRPAAGGIKVGGRKDELLG